MEPTAFKLIELAIASIFIPVAGILAWIIREIIKLKQHVARHEADCGVRLRHIERNKEEHAAISARIDAAVEKEFAISLRFFGESREEFAALTSRLDKIMEMMASRKRIM